MVATNQRTNAYTYMQQVLKAVKIIIFLDTKIAIFFLMFAQSIACGYTLEPPQFGSNECPRSMF